MTAEVPTLLPMLRTKLISPATALLLSGGIPRYATIVAGMKIKPIGTYCAILSHVAETKLI